MGKVIGTFCQKSEPPGIKTPGYTDVLPDSKIPVSKGVGTPGSSQTKVYKVNLVERNFRCICLFFNAATVITSNTIVVNYIHTPRLEICIVLSLLITNPAIAAKSMRTDTFHF